MEKKLKNLVKYINKIIKNFGDNTADWTTQISLNSADPGKINYACMIHTPFDGVEPLAFVCDSYEELEDKLKQASKDLNRDLVEIVYHQSEIARCERLSKYHEEKIKELSGES